MTSEDENEQGVTDNTMVHIELSNNWGGKRTPNGSLPSGTPHGSLHSLVTPSSSCSHLTIEAVDNAASDRNSARIYPDLVQGAEVTDTQTAIKTNGDVIHQNGDVIKDSGDTSPECEKETNDNRVPVDKTKDSSNTDSQGKLPNTQGAAVFANTQKDDKVKLLSGKL